MKLTILAWFVELSLIRVNHGLFFAQQHSGSVTIASLKAGCATDHD
jgi:hypothetical protein